MKRFLFLCLMLVFLVSCAGVSKVATPPAEPVKADVTITIVQKGDKVAIEATTPDGDKIHKAMEVANPGLRLSQLSAISGDKLFVDADMATVEIK